MPSLDNSITVNTPLVSNPLSDEHHVFAALRKYALEAKEQQETAPDEAIQAWKKFSFYAALLLKPGSCTYGFILSQHAVNLFAKQPYIKGGEWPLLPYVAAIFATLLMLSDMGNSVFSSKSGVRNLLMSPDWQNGLKQAITNIKSGEFPKLLLSTGLVCTIASGVKGYVGCNFILNLLAQYAGLSKYQSTKSVAQALSVLVGLDSAFCFYAFQIHDKGMRTVRENRVLDSEEVRDHWESYQKDKRFALFLINLSGFFIALASSIVTAMSVFYSKGSFDIELWPTVYFAVVSISSIINNLVYTSNPIYKHWWMQDKHLRNASDCSDCRDEQTLFGPGASAIGKRIVGAVNSFGTGVTYYPAIMQVILAVSQQKDSSELPNWLAAGGLVLSVIMATLLIPRVYTMTTGRGGFFRQPEETRNVQLPPTSSDDLSPDGESLYPSPHTAIVIP